MCAAISSIKCSLAYGIARMRWKKRFFFLKSCHGDEFFFVEGAKFLRLIFLSLELNGAATRAKLDSKRLKSLKSPRNKRNKVKLRSCFNVWIASMV